MKAENYPEEMVERTMKKGNSWTLFTFFSSTKQLDEDYLDEWEEGNDIMSFYKSIFCKPFTQSRDRCR
ncbi:hypothetical protein AMELA_G00137060 [Ameiurus melas]|uniref:Uncharacterized protein n=1 Tax=Ameiurus melas TaxID=219545 RepID=A0A7J6AMD1_AMEME|nr:hypothetical protein AMELA_G00137060 [Ameiurus melas]